MSPQTTTPSVTFAQILKNGHRGPAITKDAPIAPAINGLKIAKPSEISMRKAMGLERKITSQVLFYTNEDVRSEVNQHRIHLKKADKEFREMLNGLFSDAKIWLTGSYAAGIDLPTSDLDFTVEIPSLRDKTPGQKLEMVEKKMKMVQSRFEVKKVTGGKIPVLVLKHGATRIDVDVTIDNDPPKRNTQLLIWYSQIDARFAPLCRAIKHWAAQTGVECSRRGRLNSFSICLMVIHFLQKGVTPNVLTNLQSMFPELIGEIRVDADERKRRNYAKEIEAMRTDTERRLEKKNEQSLGALFMGFFKYYKDFDFISNWISVRRGTHLQKKTDRNGNQIGPRGYYTVVEDPFLVSPWNCAGTVKQDDIYERIVEEFRKYHDHIRKNKTIFFGMSIRREAIEKAGRERDMMDFGTINLQKEPTTLEEWWQRSYKPNDFWEKVHIERDPRKDRWIGMPWPEKMAVFY